MDSNWTSQTFDMLGALLGVLAIIFIVAWLLKRLQYRQSPERRHLKVISVLSLSARERVILVQAGAEQVLMGVSGAGIQHLHTLKEPVALEEDVVDPATGGFAGQLRNLMTGNES